jgi:Bacterial type II secretion system protein G.
MSAMMRRAVYILLFLILAACGNHEGGSLLSSDNYTGFWTSRHNQRETLTIRRDGDGYVIEDENGKKFVGVVRDGILSVSGPMGRIDALYSPSSKSLILAGREFERTGDAGTINDLTAAKRTMADMRTIATAWEARATDVNKYNAAGQQFVELGYDATPQLDTMISPTYIKRTPLNDGWGNPFDVRVDAPVGGTQPAQTYSIRSKGKDGIKEKSPAGGATRNFDCDIIYSNGAFQQYPEGVQQR